MFLDKLFIFLLSLVLVIFQPGLSLSKEPELPVIVINSIASLYSPVVFNHALHVRYASCVECHHHTTGQEPSDPYCLPCHRGESELTDISCSSCHYEVARRELQKASSPKEAIYHFNVPTLKGAYHLNCISCHEVIGTGPVTCKECHLLTDKGNIFYRTDLASGNIRSEQEEN